MASDTMFDRQREQDAHSMRMGIIQGDFALGGRTLPKRLSRGSFATGTKRQKSWFAALGDPEDFVTSWLYHEGPREFEGGEGI